MADDKKKSSSKSSSKKDDGEKKKSKKAEASGGGKKASSGGSKQAAPKGPPELQLGETAAKVRNIAGVVGLVALGAAYGVGSGDPKSFLYSYLIAFFYALTLGLGALFWVNLQHLVNSHWCMSIRRVGEFFASNFIVLAILSLPIVATVVQGSDIVYKWNNEELAATDHLLHHKSPYLNKTFFLIRVVFYFGFWFWLSQTHFRTSLKQDQTGDPKIPKRLQAISAPSMLLFAITLTFAAIDFLMSLEFVFFSTMWGVYIFAGAVSSFHAIFILTLMWLQGQGKLKKEVTVEHFHDLGKMMFAFVVFWSYIAFSQFMLIWYADIPEETFWYKHRFLGDFGDLSWVLLFGHFAIPFLGLVSRWVKRSRRGLAFWAFWMLGIQFCDLYWIVKPALDPTSGDLQLGIVDFLCLIGTVSIFLAGVAHNAVGKNLMAIKDPRLEKGLAFQNI